MNYSIEASTREKIGRQAHRLRREMKIPGVLYGNKIPSKPITLPRSEFVRLLGTAGYSNLIDVKIDGGEPVKVLLKAVQVDPISMDPIHADFYQVDMNKEIEAEVPLKFVGESKAVKEEGGTLVKSIDEVEVRCLPANLPAEITVDLSALQTFDDAITIADLKLPEGVEVEQEPELTIVNVARPLTEEELKALEESQVGDVSAVVSEAEEKKETEATEGEEGASEEKPAEEAKSGEAGA